MKRKNKNKKSSTDFGSDNCQRAEGPAADTHRERGTAHKGQQEGQRGPGSLLVEIQASQEDRKGASVALETGILRDIPAGLGVAVALETGRKNVAPAGWPRGEGCQAAAAAQREDTAAGKGAAPLPFQTLPAGAAAGGAHWAAAVVGVGAAGVGDGAAAAVGVGAGAAGVGDGEAAAVGVGVEGGEVAAAAVAAVGVGDGEAAAAVAVAAAVGVEGLGHSLPLDRE